MILVLIHVPDQLGGRAMVLGAVGTNGWKNRVDGPAHENGVPRDHGTG